MSNRIPDYIFEEKKKVKEVEAQGMEGTPESDQTHGFVPDEPSAYYPKKEIKSFGDYMLWISSIVPRMIEDVGVLKEQIGSMYGEFEANPNAVVMDKYSPDISELNGANPLDRAAHFADELSKELKKIAEVREEMIRRSRGQ